MDAQTAIVIVGDVVVVGAVVGHVIVGIDVSAVIAVAV